MRAVGITADIAQKSRNEKYEAHLGLTPSDELQ